MRAANLDYLNVDCRLSLFKDDLELDFDMLLLWFEKVIAQAGRS